MAFHPVFQNTFEKDLVKAKRRGKDIRKLERVVHLLVAQEPLLPQHRNHKLKSNWDGYWECHIEPDWLLIYKVTREELILVRTGTHSDLF